MKHPEAIYSIDSVENLLLEINTACNLKCPGCYMEERFHDDLAFSVPTFHMALDVVRPQTVSFLGGEPLLWPHLRKCIRASLGTGARVYLFSNLIYMTPDLAAEFLESGVFVTGKLNVGDLNDPAQLKIQCDLIGASPRSVYRMIQGIEILKAAGYKEPLLSVNNFVRAANVPYVAEFLLWCKQNDVRPSVEISCASNDLNQEEITSIVEQIKPYTTRPVVPPHFFHPCYHTVNSIYIRGNGDIQACSGSKTVLANLHSSKDAIRDALAHPIMAGRRAIIDKIEGECSMCPLLKDCRGGCRAYAERGSLYGSYEKCYRV